MDKNPSTPSPTLQPHDPLPYLVRVRATATGEVSDIHVTAYSVVEAVFQAFFEHQGTGVVVSVSADVPAWHDTRKDKVQ